MFLDGRESDRRRPWDTSPRSIWPLGASRIATWKNFRMDGMSVFDLVHTKVVTNEIFMQTFGDP